MRDLLIGVLLLAQATAARGEPPAATRRQPEPFR
jgi:hypothetical protein